MHRAELTPWIKPLTTNAFKRLQLARKNNANKRKKITIVIFLKALTLQVEIRRDLFWHLSSL